MTSPGFLIGLFLLLLNDFALKPLLHNWLTGKLSDLAGLFIFPLFWSALFPRFRRAIFSLTAVTFIIWKSGHSQPLIDAWNGLAILPVGRTADPSDLLALVVLPLSFFYCGHRRQETPNRLAPYFIAGASLLAFTATSYRTEFPYDNRYHIQQSQVELTRRLFNLSRLDEKYRVSPCGFEGINPSNIEVEIPSDFCFSHVDASVGISEEQGRAVITLKKMEHQCPEGRDDKETLRAIFEKEFIGKLNQASPVFPADELPEVSAPTHPNKARQLYLVPLGELPGNSVEDLASFFRKEYGARVRVLKSLPLTEAARDTRFPNSRPQAERMVEHMKSEYPKIASNSEALMIGITEDMYVAAGQGIYPSHYEADGRFAVISTNGLNPATFCEPPNEELLRTRLRKLSAKIYRDSISPPAAAHSGS